MKLFNIGMVLNWARKENDRRGCDSAFIKAAEDEYAALLKINKESAKLEAKLEETARPTKQSTPCDHEHISAGHSPFVACVCDDCGEEV